MAYRSRRGVAGGLLTGLGQALMNRHETERREQREDELRARQERREDELRAHQEQREDRLRERGERREDVMQMRQWAWEYGKELRQRQADVADQKAQREHERGLLADVVIGDDDTAHGITRGGQRINLGVKTRQTGRQSGGSGDRDPLTAGDQRIIEAVIGRHTTEDLAGAETDWDSVERTLRSIGRDDLAALFASAESAGSSRTPDREAVEDVNEITKPARRLRSQDSALNEYFTILDRALSSARGQDGDTNNFDSPEAVREAYRANRISREQALQILRSQFGYQ